MFSSARILAFSNKEKRANNKDLLRISYSTRLFTHISAFNSNRNLIKHTNKFYTMGKMWLRITEQISTNKITSRWRRVKFEIMSI